MKVLNLRCAHDHRFEGWFGSDDDYRTQIEAGLLVCPLCGDLAIERLPSAPRLNVSRARPPAAETPPRAADDGAGRATAASGGQGPGSGKGSQELTLQSLWMQAVRHVIANTDDVGDRFAEEARRIHYGEADERPIRGQATRDEAEALRDEGIEVMPLPVPPALKGPLQ
jgi:hypothetical protein